MSATSIHASCLVIGEAGVLVRGEPGSGKSRLVAELLVRARGLGFFARLVADDRVRVAARHGRLLARPVPAIAGRLEVRGLGLVGLDIEGAAVVRIVVDCSPEPPPRLPEPGEREVTLEGIALPRLTVPVAAARADLVLGQICGLHDTLVTD